MYGTGNDGYLIRERNAEMLREVTLARLERRLRTNQVADTGMRGLRTRKDPLAVSGDVSAERMAS